jgi:hypothetical protein
MRRMMVLVTVVLVMTAMLLASAAPAVAVRFWTFGPGSGTPVPTTVCESPAVVSSLIGWRNGTCWVFHPAP